MAKLIVEKITTFFTFQGEEKTIYICNSCHNEGQSPCNNYCSNCGEKIEGLIFDKERS